MRRLKLILRKPKNYILIFLLYSLSFSTEEIFSRHADNIIRILEKNGIKYAEIYPDLGEMYLKIVLKRIMLSR